jgi:hypothetical protein
VISSISPTSGANGTSITITGAGFVSSAGNTVNLDGSSFVESRTSYSSGTLITFTLNKLSASSDSVWYGQTIPVGAHQITVTNANGTSNTATFTVTS